MPKTGRTLVATARNAMAAAAENLRAVESARASSTRNRKTIRSLLALSSTSWKGRER